MKKTYINNTKKAALISLILLLVAIYVVIYARGELLVQIIFTGILVYASISTYIESKSKKVEINNNLLTYHYLGTFYTKKTIEIDLNSIYGAIFFENRKWMLIFGFLRNYYWPSYIIFLKENFNLKKGVQIYLDSTALKNIKTDLAISFPNIAWQEIDNIDIFKATLKKI